MALQSPRLNLIRLEGAMVPAKHLLRPVCSRFTRPYREALPAYWPPTKQQHWHEIMGSNPYCCKTVGFEVLSQPRRQSGTPSSVAHSSHLTIWSLLPCNVASVNSTEKTLKFPKSQNSSYTLILANRSSSATVQQLNLQDLCMSNVLMKYCYGYFYVQEKSVFYARHVCNHFLPNTIVDTYTFICQT